MKLPMMFTTAGIAALALSGAIAGTAAAASNAGARPAIVHVAQSEPAGPDTDAIQQGDQTSPDAGTAAATSASPSANGENPGEQEAAGEQQASPDGPGGHADPAGNVQHEFTGVE
jgi:hypothetical protein